MAWQINEWHALNDTDVFDVPHDWFVFNSDMEVIAQCPSQQSAQLIADLLNGKPTILPKG